MPIGEVMDFGRRLQLTARKAAAARSVSSRRAPTTRRPGNNRAAWVSAVTGMALGPEAGDRPRSQATAHPEDRGQADGIICSKDMAQRAKLTASEVNSCGATTPNQVPTTKPSAAIQTAVEHAKTASFHQAQDLGRATSDVSFLTRSGKSRQVRLANSTFTFGRISGVKAPLRSRGVR